jgi:hypothetical protein
MGLRRQVIDTVFGGNRDPLAHIIKRTKGTDVSPDGVITAPRGTLCCMDYSGDAADDDIYLNTSTTASGGTTWTLIYDASTQGHLY